MVDLNGYLILVVTTTDGTIRLYGSPADRAELEVGDEIVEVNGHCLQGCTHSQVIDHIHKCIKSRTIKLKVKRTCEDHDGETPGVEDIQDAFVIAVEEQAKQRLERLSHLHKVTAVDIGQIKDLGSSNQVTIRDCTGDLSFRQSESHSNADNYINPTSEIEVEEGECDNQCDTDGDSEVECSDQNTVTTDSQQPITQDKSHTMETSVLNGYIDGLNNPHYGGHAGIDNSYEPEMSATESDLSDGGRHREMAIDCPASFVGHRKGPPRYPPPNTTAGVHSSPNAYVGTPSRQLDSFNRPQRILDDSQGQSQVPPLTAAEKHEHMGRIKKYQEDLRKRKQEEERQAYEEEFLRTSLRGSKKLQALEESRAAPPSTGIVNPIYQQDDEEIQRLAGDSHSQSATLPVRQPQHIHRRAPFKPVQLENVIVSLQNIHPSEHKESQFLVKLFQNPAFHQALSIHNKVVTVGLQTPPPAPVGSSAEAALSQVQAALASTHSSSPTAQELRGLLLKPHLKSLMHTHDKVAEQKAEPTKSTTDDDEREYLYERASTYGEESIKVVRLQKTADPLGATVRNEGDSVIIGRIVKGGAAEASGLLHEGDEVLEINGIDIRGKSINDVCDLMASLTGTLTFLVVPCQDFCQPSPGMEHLVHVKAHFDYDPEDDMYIPCRELGISFQKGDILHVRNQDDPNWWQAYREGEEDQALAGLVPSGQFQEKREAMKQTIVGDGKDSNKKSSRCRCRCGRQKKKKKKQMYSSNGEELDAQEILTYEEVSLYYPQPNRKRPIVLIGPPNVGRHELRQRLMESDPDRFAAVVPHTSRPRKEEEIDGKDYYFVSRHTFEQDITDHKFVEFGEYEKNLYGTSLESIRYVVGTGKISILNLDPQSLRILQESDLKPYIIFIRPPNMEKLKIFRQKQGAKASDDELKDIIEKAREMEDNFGHYFDLVIVNFDLDRSYDEFLAEVNRLEIEPQWVPSHWVT